MIQSKQRPLQTRLQKFIFFAYSDNMRLSHTVNKFLYQQLTFLVIVEHTI